MTSEDRLDRAAIAARIPHAGRMCLLDRVVSWDDDHIACSGPGSPAPGEKAHPLAQSCLDPHPGHGGRLPATAAIEYAAQAMALHGRLVQERLAATCGDRRETAPRRGFLAGLRSVRLHCRWIEPGWPVLSVRVERFAGDDVQVLYDFHVSAGGPIVQGRAVVILDAGARAPAPPAAGAARGGAQSP